MAFAIWGDCEHYPLGVVFNYHKCLEQMVTDKVDYLVRHACCEQKILELSWCTSTQPVKTTFGADQSNPLRRPSLTTY